MLDILLFSEKSVIHVERALLAVIGFSPNPPRPTDTPTYREKDSFNNVTNAFAVKELSNCNY